MQSILHVLRRFSFLGVFLAWALPPCAAHCKQLPAAREQDQGNSQEQFPPAERLPVSPGMRQELKFPGGNDSTITFQFSPDGKKVIGGTHPGSLIACWDVESGELLTTIETAEKDWKGTVGGFHVSPDWSTVFACSNLQTVKVVEERGEQKLHFEFESCVRAWDLSTGELKRTYTQDPQRGILFMQLTPDGKRFATCAERPGVFSTQPSRVVSIWNIEDGTFWDLEEGVSQFNGFTPGGELIAYRAGNPGPLTLLTIDLNSFESRTTLTWDLPEHDNISVVSFTPDGRYMVGFHQSILRADAQPDIDVDIVWWDAQTGKERKRSYFGRNTGVSHHAYSPDGKFLAKTNARVPELQLYLFRTADQTLQHTVPLAKAEAELQPLASSTVFSPDGNYAVVCVKRRRMNKFAKHIPLEIPLEQQEQPRIHIIDVESGAIVKTLVGPQGWATSPQFSPDGKTFAISGPDTVMLWDWATMCEGLDK